MMMKLFQKDNKAPIQRRMSIYFFKEIENDCDTITKSSSTDLIIFKITWTRGEHGPTADSFMKKF